MGSVTLKEVTSIHLCIKGSAADETTQRAFSVYCFSLMSVTMPSLDLLALFLLIAITSGSVLGIDHLKPVTVLDESNFQSFVEHPNIRLVAYHDPFPETTENHESIYEGKMKNVDFTAFLPVFQRAAKYVSKYDIDVGIVDCIRTPSVGECGNNANNVFVYGYSNSKLSTELSYEHLLDEDSLIGNLLHLNIISKMPIVNSAQVMEDTILMPNRGKANVLFGFFQYIGDSEHRAFIEAAYPYLDDFAFVVFTDKEAFEQARFYEPLEKGEKAKMILFQCKDSVEDEVCSAVIYRGGLNKENFANSFQNLKVASKAFDVPSEGNTDVFNDLKIHTASLYYDSESKELVKQVAEKLLINFPGVLAVLKVDADHPDVTPEEEGTKLPAFALKLIGENYPTYMTHTFSEVSVLKYSRERISEYQGVVTRSLNGKDSVVNVKDEMVAAPINYQGMGLVPQTQIITDHIQALTDKTFPTMTSRDVPTLVLFSAKFDTASMAFLRSYAEAAMSHVDKTSLTRIDCFDWTYVCTAQKVAHYPHVRVYQSGREPIIYRGMLDGEAVINFLKVLQMGTPLKITSPEEAQSFLDGSYPQGLQGLKMDASVAIGLSSEADIPDVIEVAHYLGGEFFLAYGTGDVAKAMCSGSEPCAVIMAHDEPKKVVSLGDVITASQLTQVIQAHRLPALAELTIASAPKIYSQNKPIVMYFGETTDKEYETVATLAGSGDFSDHVFTWINCVDSQGRSILHTYHPEASLPALALLNRKMGHVYVPEATDFTAESIKDWMRSVASGKETPVYAMPVTKWKPLHEGYDFEALIREDERKKKDGEKNEADGRVRFAKLNGSKMAPSDDIEVKVAAGEGMAMKAAIHEEL